MSDGTERVNGEAAPQRALQAPPQRSPSQRLSDHRPPLQRLAGELGNRQLARVIARMREGEGILPDGVVHPQVESAIGAARGTGKPLDPGVRTQFSSGLGDSLGDVRVHTGEGAAALARAVSARAFTVGSDLFFAPGEYQPGSSGGNELIAHELAHVVQQRGAPQSGPLTVSQPGDALEREAEAAASQLA